MIGSWVWKSKNRDNNPLEKLYEWYCVKQVGNFRMAYAVRPQYRIDPKTHEETNDIECYITIEYQKCVDDSIKKLEDEKAAWEREKAKAERSAKILAKAKELNIPQSRIDEGFVIADDADDAAIETYLTKVAGNIKNNSLPTNPHFNIRTDQEVSKEDADKIAEKIMG